MDRFHAMQVFVAVAEEAGFAAAARRLGMSPPAVTRAVAALEARLGVRLLTRTTRFVRATDAGQRYLEDARRILAEAEAADEAAAGINAEPRGELAVTAPVLFGRRYVMPGIVDYLQQYPGTTVSAMFVDRVVNLLEEGLDVGVRIGELPDSGMRAVRAGSVRLTLCASAAYLERHGSPRTPAELAGHTCIVSTAAGGGARSWRFGAAGSAQRLQARLSVTTNDAAVEAAVRGLGITRLLSYQVADDIAAGRLQRLLPEFEPPPVPVHVVHREGRLASTKLRAFVDLMAARLRSDPALAA